MSTEMTTKDFEQAAIELDAAAILLSGFIDKLDGFLSLCDSYGVPRVKVPPEFRILIDDLFSAHSSAERTFKRYSSIYPSISNAWISATRIQFGLTTSEGLRSVFGEKKALLEQGSHIARAKAGLPDKKESSRNHYHIGDINVSAPQIINNITGGNFVQSSVGNTGGTLNGYIEALQLENCSSEGERELKQSLALLRSKIDSEPELSPAQRIAAASDLSSFSEELKKPANEQNQETKKLFWGRLTEIIKFSSALVGLAAAVAKLTGMA